MLFFRSPFPTFAPMSRKACQDILVKRNSMLSESPPRNELSYINSVESVPIHRRGLSHIEFMACGEPRERMTEVCAFFIVWALLTIRTIIMKRKLFKATACLFLLLSVSVLNAQNAKEFKPEFTARLYTGIFDYGATFSGGVRLDDKHTVGLMVGPHEKYYDHVPGYVKSITTSVFARRYFHLGERQRFAFYSDLSVGAGWVYKVDGKYWVEPSPNGNYEKKMIEKSLEMLTSYSLGTLASECVAIRTLTSSLVPRLQPTAWGYTLV